MVIKYQMFDASSAYDYLFDERVYNHSILILFQLLQDGWHEADASFL